MVVIHNHTEHTLNIVTDDSDIDNLIYMEKRNTIKHNRIKSFNFESKKITVYIDSIRIYEGQPSCKYLHVINSNYQTPSTLAKFIKRDEIRANVAGDIIITYSYIEDHDDISKMCKIRKVLIAFIILMFMVLYIATMIVA